VSGSAVDIEVIFLNVLAVIAFGVDEAKQPLLQDGIAAVPKSQSKAKLLLVVGDTG
jgi:hypothetical protein